VIAIAHRLSTLGSFDRVVVLEAGVSSRMARQCEILRRRALPRRDRSVVASKDDHSKDDRDTARNSARRRPAIGIFIVR